MRPRMELGLGQWLGKASQKRVRRSTGRMNGSAMKRRFELLPKGTRGLEESTCDSKSQAAHSLGGLEIVTEAGRPQAQCLHLELCLAASIQMRYLQILAV